MKIYALKRKAQKSPDQFLQWIDTNEAEKFAKQLPDPNVLKALRFFVYLKNNEEINLMRDIAENISLAVYLVTIDDALQDANLSPYIEPLRKVLDDLEGTVRVEAENIPKNGLESLDQLIAFYSAENNADDSSSVERLTRAEKIRRARLDMAKYLINRFTNEISNTLREQGKDELAEKVNEGILTDPSKLIKELGALNYFRYTEYNHQIVKELMRHIWNNYGENNYKENYWYIKNALWSIAYGNYQKFKDYQKHLAYLQNADEINDTNNSEEFMEQYNAPIQDFSNIMILPQISLFFYTMLSNIRAKNPPRGVSSWI